MPVKSVREAVQSFSQPAGKKLLDRGFMHVGFFCRRCETLRKDQNRLCDCCVMLEDPMDIAGFISGHWAPVGIPKEVNRAIRKYAVAPI